MTPKLPEEHVTPMKHLGYEFAAFLKVSDFPESKHSDSDGVGMASSFEVGEQNRWHSHSWCEGF